VTGGGAQPLLLVSVGTDHHPFDRLIGWIDGWLAANPGRLRCLMQTGTSAPPRGPAEWQAYLAFDALEGAMAEAAAVVCHGGPGTILGARHLGAVPIVVPRQHRLGEHVDDHQVAFARRLAAAGDGGIHLAETEPDLHRLLDRVVAEPGGFRAGPEARATTAAVREFGRLVEGLVGGQPARRTGSP
jgi:UDP-N-acetylglucosamine transferase subunit ALG13